MFSTVIVIPSYNELPTLKSLVKKLNKNNILIIDDASTDGTSKFLKEKKIIHISNKENIGYEGSLIKAFKYLKQKSKIYDYLITIDADNEHDPKYIKKIIKKVHINKIDLIVCNRSRLNRFIEKIASLLFYKKYKINDPFSGFKIYRTEKLFRNINFITTKYYLAELVPIFIKKKLKVENFKVKSLNVKNRKSKAGNILKVSLKMFYFIKKYCI
tara:strand:- start:1114 stop:1755 length:642 start_codon:yes stop_codon:yes gene_type:complete